MAGRKVVGSSAAVSVASWQSASFRSPGIAAEEPSVVHSRPPTAVLLSLGSEMATVGVGVGGCR